MQDIGEERRLQAQLIQSQKMESMGTLAAGVAHDLRNILQAIGGHDELLARQEGLDAKAARHLEAISQAVERAQALTRKLLAFSRNEPLQRTRVDPAHLLEEVSSLLRPSLGAKTHLVVESQIRLPRAMMDPHQIHQVLVNLVLNAQAALQGEGSIILRGGRTAFTGEEEGPKRHEPGPYLFLEVADTGQGIPPEILPRVFEPFFTTKGEKGTGLGLSVAYGIAQAHGGWIDCESTQGKGTRFVLFLPLQTDESEEPSGPHPAYAG